MDLVGGVVQAHHEPVAGGDVDGVGHEAHALDTDGGLDRATRGGHGFRPRVPLPASADGSARHDGRPGGQQPEERPAAVGGACGPARRLGVLR